MPERRNRSRRVLACDYNSAGCRSVYSPCYFCIAGRMRSGAVGSVDDTHLVMSHTSSTARAKSRR